MNSFNKMSDTSNNALSIQGLSKKYRIYDKPTDRLKELMLRNRKCYHREYWALKDFSYNFQPHITALIGPNGSGKSTLLQLIAGVLQPTEGEIIAKGRITAILELGASFQSEFTGRENALLYGMILGISKEEMESHLEEIADFAEIGEFFDQPTSTYSSGMVVRLAFSCATVVNPDILLVDEALAVGDGYFQKKCKKRIDSLLKKSKTIILVTHDMTTVEWFCQSAILLSGGKIIADGDVRDVIPQYKEIAASGKDLEHKTFNYA